MKFRPLLVAALLAASMLFVTPAQAAEGAILTDDAGDVVFRTNAGDAPASGNSQGDPVDLLEVAMVESEEMIRLTLTVASLSEGDPTGPILTGYPEYAVLFDWRGVTYRVEFNIYGAGLLAGTAQGYVCVLRVSSSGDADFVDCYGSELDLAGGVMSAEIAKVIILDRQNRMPVKGTALENVRGEAARTFFSGGVTGKFWDTMPAEGEKGPSFPITMGDASLGDLVLSSPDAVRVSNGGATTFVYQVALTNLGDRTHEVALGATDVPADWAISVRTPVTLGARETRDITVLVTVPFTHEHGGFSSLNITAVSNTDAGSSAKMRLGVLHTPIPQPAGHHPDLYLHGSQFNFPPFSTLLPFDYGWLNTEAATENDIESLTPYSSNDKFYWRIYLNPGLQMGLDFDINKFGTLVGNLGGDDYGARTMTAALYLRADGDEILLADGPAYDLTLDPTKTAPFAFTLTPTLDADYIAYEPGQNLFLELSVTKAVDLPLYINVGKVQPLLQTADFKLTLPLDEYHDRLSGAAEAANGLNLIADGAVEKVGRAGSTLTYRFTLEAIGKGGTFNVEVAGADASAGALANSGAIQLGAGEKKTITLGVAIPGDANAGQSYEVLVFAHDKDDPSRMAIARTKTVVGAGAEASADEGAVFAAAQDEARDTPGPGLAMLAGALVVALAFRRRKSK